MLTKTGSWYNQDEFQNYAKPLRTKDNFFAAEGRRVGWVCTQATVGS